MAYIYLIIDKGNALAKVGYAGGLHKRVPAYGTSNPLAVIVDHCETYRTSRRTLETLAHKRMRALGGVPVQAVMTGARSEWYTFPNDAGMIDRLALEGLAVLDLGNRKYLGAFRL